MTVAEILALAGQYGSAGIFAVLWWLERTERKEEQRAGKEMFEKTVNALAEHKQTVETIKNIFAGKPG